jgi:hypothetical protein
LHYSIHEEERHARFELDNRARPIPPFKGGEYEVLGIATHSETHEKLSFIARSTMRRAFGFGRWRCSRIGRAWRKTVRVLCPHRRDAWLRTSRRGKAWTGRLEGLAERAEFVDAASLTACGLFVLGLGIALMPGGVGRQPR